MQSLHSNIELFSASEGACFLTVVCDGAWDLLPAESVPQITPCKVLANCQVFSFKNMKYSSTSLTSGGCTIVILKSG